MREPRLPLQGSGPGAVGWRVSLIERFAVSPAVLDYAVRGEVGLWTRFVSYAGERYAEAG